MRLTRAQLPHTVTVRKLRDVTGRDRFNNEVRRRRGVAVDLRARVVPNAGLETIDDRDALRARYLVILPPDVDVAGVDELGWEGRVLQVDGPPRPMPGRRGVHHVELDAFVVTG